jgi:hypothetical protein
LSNVTRAAQAQSDQETPLRFGEAVPAHVSLGTRITIDGDTYRVAGLERTGAVINWMYLEDLATGAFVEQESLTTHPRPGRSGPQPSPQQCEARTPRWRKGASSRAYTLAVPAVLRFDVRGSLRAITADQGTWLAESLEGAALSGNLMGRGQQLAIKLRHAMEQDSGPDVTIDADEVPELLTVLTINSIADAPEPHELLHALRRSFWDELDPPEHRSG